MQTEIAIELGVLILLLAVFQLTDFLRTWDEITPINAWQKGIARVAHYLQKGKHGETLGTIAWGLMIVFSIAECLALAGTGFILLTAESPWCILFFSLSIATIIFIKSNLGTQ